MPVLADIKHERFAQLVVSGRPLGESYTEAGYRAHESNPTRLANRPKVAARIKELRERAGQILERHLQGQMIAAHKAADVTLDKLIGMLLEDRELAKQCRNAGAAVSATMGLAKLTGHAIDRKEVGKAGEFNPDADLNELKKHMAEQLAAMLQNRGNA